MDMSVSAVKPTLDIAKPAAAPTPGDTTMTAADKKASGHVAATGKVERDQVEQAVKDIQAFVDSNQRNLDFSIDETTGDVVVKIVATTSGEVIRQLPSEEALKMAQRLKDPHSLLFDEQA
ncbi:flagellar protein FlaG [Pseudomonas sp. hsmgli-8]|uniref:Flagellar protein FlaG n=2 Tax=Pseudomonas TaxID=286 RepID=A0ABX0YFZ0_9PSED|nr:MULTISPECIES: flagellar protein FlaG [Pseudomonas]MBF7142410.1 flagellar protein FlaG [Pseudomonas sp. LY10J]NJP00948.1 flagellar protein FlaG [Pseudomonas quercus]